MHHSVNTGRLGATRGATQRLSSSSPYPLEALRPGWAGINSTQVHPPQKDEQQYCHPVRPRNHRLQDSLYFGSAYPEIPPKTDPSIVPQVLLSSPEGVRAPVFVQPPNNHLVTYHQHSTGWNSDMPSSSSMSYADSQHMFPAAQASFPAEVDPNVRSSTRTFSLVANG